MFMKKNEELVGRIGMQFDEAIELFGDETLETMAMTYVVGGATHNGCTQSGTCIYDSETYNGCTQNNCSKGTSEQTSTSGGTDKKEEGSTNSGGTSSHSQGTGNIGSGNTVQGIIVGCKK